MTIRHFATIAGLITLLIVATFDLARHDDPDPYMIVSDTSGDAFLYHEASGDVISVTADWEGVYVFSTGEIGSDKGLYTITPDGWLVMHYSTRMNSSNPSGLLLTALFKFNPSGTIVRPAMPGDPEAFLLTTTPDDEWMIFSQQGMFYRQRVGSEQVELITDRSPLAFKAWLSDNRTMIVSDLGPDSSLHLLDILTGNIQPVDLDSAFGSLTPSHKPDWFLLRESYDTGQAINYINFETNERIELLPPQNDTTCHRIRCKRRITGLHVFQRSEIT